MARVTRQAGHLFKSVPGTKKVTRVAGHLYTTKGSK